MQKRRAALFLVTIDRGIQPLFQLLDVLSLASDLLVEQSDFLSRIVQRLFIGVDQLSVGARSRRGAILCESRRSQTTQHV